MNRRTKNPPLFQQLKHEWLELDLAYKSVFIIGTILLFQLIYAIFFCQTTISTTVDSVFRTSLSSIFGYILGMNISHSSKKSKSEDKPPITTEINPVLRKKKADLIATNIRVLFSTLVCMTCIVVLILVNCTNHLNYIEGINQISHLISITIGFLISDCSHKH